MKFHNFILIIVITLLINAMYSQDNLRIGIRGGFNLSNQNITTTFFDLEGGH